MKNIIYFLLCIAMFSCSKDDELYSLENTIWEHEFLESENIVDDKAAEYHFGKKEVEYFAINKEGKIARRIGVYPYTVKKDVLTIGIKSCTLSEKSFIFNGKLFIKKTN